MKHKLILPAMFFFLIFILNMSIYGQDQPMDRGGHFHPDSLTNITVTGTVIVDSSTVHPHYYLDEESDGNADYFLNFGPFWYEPDSSNATRPADGETITITGGLHESVTGDNPVIVVYEINQNFWREPFSPTWALMGKNSHMGMQHQSNFMGFAFGWMHDTLHTDSLSGSVLVDSTFVFERYFLDVNEDEAPDYFLNFGPFWYKPTSGAKRPLDGDQIKIVGGMLERQTLPMIVVLEINDQVWRDSVSFQDQFTGGWIHRNLNNPRRIHAPFDTLDWIEMNPGWHMGGGGHHGGMMPDSLFGQMLELFPQNIPNTENENVFAGYEVGMFFPNGMNGMWQSGRGGHMNFGSNTQFQLHYNDIQLQGFNINENSVLVKYWDNDVNDWIEADDATINPDQNTVTFSSDKTSNYVILTGTEEVTSIDAGNDFVTGNFLLKQNFPNPFNPTTMIEFELKKSNKVILTVYNVLGQKIHTLLNKELNAGVHRVQFTATDIPAGIYFYELKAGNFKKIRKMTVTR